MAELTLGKFAVPIFDQLLAQQAEQYSAEIRFGHEVINVDVESTQPILTVKDEQTGCKFQAKFLLDASGFGRILPKFLDLESPSDFPIRRAVFTHIEDGILDDADFDREKILITVHAKDQRAWYWLIPLPMAVVLLVWWQNKISLHTMGLMHSKR